VSLADTNEGTSNWWLRDIEDDPRYRELVMTR
jgi:hypothetical protein